MVVEGQTEVSAMGEADQCDREEDQVLAEALQDLTHTTDLHVAVVCPKDRMI